LAFLNWLGQLIDQREVECLIVAGDIFDTSTPTNKSQELYYNFLVNLSRSKTCRHTVIVSGNHDSPSFLEAPKALLSGLGVHVVGRSQPQDEMLVLSDPNGQPELLVIAVPYLREADLKTAMPMETSETRDRMLARAVVSHYEGLKEASLQILAKLSLKVPVVAIGHLFLAGGKTVDDDGVRDIHAGPLAALPFSSLPEFDYFALGHLHSPQIVGGSDLARYSGSPIPMGFNELKGSKSVVICDLCDGLPAKVETVPVPVFRELGRLEGNLAQLKSGLQKYAGKDAFLELIYTGDSIIPDLRSQLEEEALRLKVEVVRIKDAKFRNLTMSAGELSPDLTSMDPVTVFERLLGDAKIPDSDRRDLLNTYQEVLKLMADDDPMA
jgi:exonuclease SbcD